MKYTVEPILKGKLGFGVFEAETKKHIARSDFIDICRRYLPKLNKGCAFNGRVPDFFCNPLLELDK